MPGSRQTSAFLFATEAELVWGISAKNDFHDGDVIVNSATYPSGKTFLFGNGEPITVTAISPQTSAGYERYFSHWEKLDQNSQVIETNSTISWSTTVTGNNIYDARFDRLINVTLSNAQFIEPGSGGTYKVNGTDVGSTWQGTFLENGSPIVLEAVPPSGEWLFADWSDGNGQNPRSLAPGNHITLYAKFKKHLLSTSTNVTAPNTQRKIIRDGDGRYYMVYESGNEIWYTRSIDGGTNWTPEQRVSDGQSEGGEVVYRTPSITVQKTATEHKVWIVWEEVEATYNHNVLSRCIDASSGTMGVEEPIPYATSGTSPMPVLSHGATGNPLYQPYLLAVWYTGWSIAGSTRQPGGNWTTPITLWYTSNLTYLTLSAICLSTGPSGHPSTPWDLAWVEGGVLKYKAIPVSGTLQLVTSPEVVATALSNEVIRNPSMVNINGFADVSWEHQFGEVAKYTIRERQRSSGGYWSNPTIWMNTKVDYYTPTLTGYSGFNNPSRATLAGRVKTNQQLNQLLYVQRDNGTWGSMTFPGSGIGPMISVGWTNPGDEILLSRGSTSPYAIQQTAVTYGGSAMKPGRATSSPLAATATKEGRGGTVVLRGGRVHLAVLLASVNDVPVTFSPFNDTLRIGNQQEMEDMLTSEAFTAEGTAELLLLYNTSAQLRQPVQFHAVVRDAETSQTLATLRAFSGVEDTLLALRVPVHFGGRLVQLGLRPVGLTSAKAFEVERWFVDETEDSSTAVQLNVASNALSAEKPLPTEYALYPNYPNPFNPSTQIKFDLPEPGNVSLVIYDVLGREVANLVDSYHEAGYQSATWNADGVASGVYFARFTVTSAVGERKYAKINKLVMMK